MCINCRDVHARLLGSLCTAGNADIDLTPERFLKLEIEF